MRKFHLTPFDAHSRRIRKGDLARIIGIPDLSNMHPGRRAESKPVFLHIRGTCKRVDGFNRYGFAKSSSRSVVARFLGGITSLSNQIYCWLNVRRMEPKAALEPIARLSYG